WQQRSFPLLAASATACAGLFTYGFLDLGNSARWYARVGRLLIGACLGCALLACLAPYTPALLSSFMLVGLCSLAAIVFTLLRWTEGYRPARLFAYGWFILIVASQVHVLSGSGLLPYGLPTLYAQQIGSLIEVVLFATALAARIRQTQLAHAATQQQLLAQERELRLEQAYGLGLQQQINEGLEQRVQERTQALEQALQELSAANRRLAELSRQDGLTGLLNRPTFDEELQRAWARAERGQRPLALLMLDLDHFKQINDNHGHLAGDACLQHVARRLRLGLRGSDLLARFGGEEFVVILPDTELAGACELAERLRADLAARPCQYGPQRIALSLSIGVAAGIPRAGLASATLLHQADQALYAAKAAGRNTVENYEASALGEA
ncbi:MAG: sensor domain-containing diguanylate cyclase, partial [Pseudomonas sp.]